MTMRYANICRMCLKDNLDNEFISLKGNRDLKVKFFYCFSIALSDSFDDHMLCRNCIDQLNSFYQLKNHVQRTHSIFFGMQSHQKFLIQSTSRQQIAFRSNNINVENANFSQPEIHHQQNFINEQESLEQINQQVNKSNDSIDFVQPNSTRTAVIPNYTEGGMERCNSNVSTNINDTASTSNRFIMSNPAMRQINVSSKLRPRQITTDRIDIAEALNRLQRSSNSVFINKSRSIQVHRANQSSPIINEVLNQSNNTEQSERYTFPPAKVQIIQSIVNDQPSTSQKNINNATSAPKQEPMEQNESPNRLRRGKQRGEIGKFIYQDKTTMGYPCVQCGRVYKSYQSIYAHIRTNHYEKYCNICDSCGKGFKTKNALRAHMASSHTKSFQCHECLKVLKSAGALSTHLLFRHQRKLSV